MNILDLPFLSVTKTELKDHGYEVWAEVANPPAFCPHCGSAERNLSKYGTKRLSKNSCMFNVICDKIITWNKPLGEWKCT